MTKISLADFERDALDTLTTYGAIPCLSPHFDAKWEENGHIDEAMTLLADWSRTRSFQQFEVEILRLENRTPLLCVTIEATAAVNGTVVLYGHMDKQPPLGDWSEGLAPFAPVRRGDRLFARGVADDGYSTFSSLLAIEAMERSGIPHARCVVLIEASEESGSPDLEAYLDVLTDHLGPVELMICLDSGALTYDRLWVTTSLRGVLMLEVAVKVLEQGQHSGAASGVVPSSFRVLRQVLDLIEDSATGELLLGDLYQPIPEEHAKNAEELAREFGDIVVADIPFLPGVRPMGESAAERILRKTWYPTVSTVGVDGIPASADAGNVLRPFTNLVLSLRLPPSLDSEKAAATLLEQLQAKLPDEAQINISIPGWADGWVSPPLAPWLKDALDIASVEAFGRAPGFTGEGGSIPFLASLGKRYPAVQFVATGVLGPHSNAHGIDEMLDLPTAVAVTNAVGTVIDKYTQSKKEN